MNTTAITAKKLTETQRRMVAGSLEIDGRADRAAEALFFQDEMTFAKNVAFSAPAREYETTVTALQGMIDMLGVEATVKALRN